MSTLNCKKCHNRATSLLTDATSRGVWTTNRDKPDDRSIRITEVFMHDNGTRCTVVRTEKLPDTHGEVTIGDDGSVRFEQGRRVPKVGGPSGLPAGDGGSQKIGPAWVEPPSDYSVPYCASPFCTVRQHWDGTKWNNLSEEDRVIYRSRWEAVTRGGRDDGRVVELRGDTGVPREADHGVVIFGRHLDSVHADRIREYILSYGTRV